MTLEHTGGESSFRKCFIQRADDKLAIEIRTCVPIVCINKHILIVARDVLHGYLQTKGICLLFP